MNRFLILIHLFLLLASGAIRLLLTNRLFSEEHGIFSPYTDIESTPIILSITLLIIFYGLLLAAVSFATSIVIVVRFYKNLFSEQGYLSFTLPVTSGQHLLAKTISGTIWAMLNFILSGLSVYIVIATSDITRFFHENSEVIRNELGFVGKYADLSWGMILIVLFFVFLVSAVFNIVMYYASVAIGQLIPNHRVLGAIAAYFVLSTVISVISLIFLAISGVLGASLNPDTGFSAVPYMIDTLGISTILSIVVTIILYLDTYWIMKKKINLD